MNAKKSKALRKVMKNMTNGTDMLQHQYSEIESRAKYVHIQGSEVVSNTQLDSSSSVSPPAELGKPKVEKVKIGTGQLINSPNTKRAVYRQLKNGLRKVEAKDVVV